jgi:hypothetical protein
MFATKFCNMNGSIRAFGHVLYVPFDVQMYYALLWKLSKLFRCV